MIEFDLHNPYKTYKKGKPRANERGDKVVKISYDSEIDALYIRLVEGPQECRTLRLTDEIALNIGKGEMLVGIEILDAKEVLGAGKLPDLVIENVPFVLAGPLTENGPRQ
ncbi:MAG: DUF2283 domain-containing protein [Thermodesulfobacteriota bacterium]